MNEFDFSFDETPWERTLAGLKRGDRFSAVRFLTLMEGEDEQAVEDALLDLEDLRVTLDPDDLPRPTGTGEAAVRLRREQQLVREGTLMTALEDTDPLKLYLRELAAIPACGDPELLALEVAEGKEYARERLLNAQLYRVVEQAESLVGRGVLLLDLIQEGSMGLWQAIMDFDGGDFQAESAWWIYQNMAKLITLQARQNGVGQKMRAAMEDYRTVDERLLSDLGRNATMEEIAVELHMSVEETRIVKNMVDNARLLSQAKGTVPKPEEEPEEEEHHVEDTALFQSRLRIMELLSGLSEADAKLLTLRFGLEGGLPLSPEETGRKLGLTPEEVVSREAAALASLRNG